MSAQGHVEEYVQAINRARLELEQAGNPSYVVVIVDEAGEPHLAQMVFAALGPAIEHAKRLMTEPHPGEYMVIVNRSAAGKRVQFTVLEPKTNRKLYQREEVIEDSFAETEGPI